MKQLHYFVQFAANLKKKTNRNGPKHERHRSSLSRVNSFEESQVVAEMRVVHLSWWTHCLHKERVLSWLCHLLHFDKSSSLSVHWFCHSIWQPTNCWCWAMQTQQQYGTHRAQWPSLWFITMLRAKEHIIKSVNGFCYRTMCFLTTCCQTYLLAA